MLNTVLTGLGTSTPSKNEPQELKVAGPDDAALQEESTEGMEVEEDGKNTASQPTSEKLQSNNQFSPSYPGGLPIDACFEASKLPLDVAIFNSARAAGGDEKIRKYLQAVLVIGGTAHIPGIGLALESRWDQVLQLHFATCLNWQK